MTMRQFQRNINARTKKDRARAYVLACRYCGGELYADGEGGWSCPKRDSHTPEQQTGKATPELRAPEDV